MYGVGINEFEKTMNVNLSPNPSNNNGAKLTFNLEENSLVNVNLLNTLGQQIESIFEGNLRKGENNIAIKTSNLTKGIYYINVNINNHIVTKKLLVN